MHDGTLTRTKSCFRDTATRWQPRRFNATSKVFAASTLGKHMRIIFRLSWQPRSMIQCHPLPGSVGAHPRRSGQTQLRNPANDVANQDVCQFLYPQLTVRRLWVVCTCLSRWTALIYLYEIHLGGTDDCRPSREETKHCRRCQRGRMSSGTRRGGQHNASNAVASTIIDGRIRHL